MALRTARNDRIKAVDTLAKYGPGAKGETEMTVVHPGVQNKLQSTVSLLSQRAPELMDELDRIWCD